MKLQGFVRVSVACVLTASIGLSEVIIPNGTKISARLEQTLTSATAEQGQQVQLSVTENVRVGDTIVIAQGAPAIGTVVLAQEKRSMGRTGKLDFSIDKVRVVDGDFVPLRYTMQKREGGSKGVSTGVMTAGVAVLFWPAAPFILLRKGKDVTINRGVTLEVFTDQDHTVRTSPALSSAPAPAPSFAPAPAAPSSTLMASAAVPHPPSLGEFATVNINSDLPGAEVELDGGFIGSTPAVSKLAPGVHKVTVKHGPNVWSRDLNVQPGGNVNVNAILKK